MSALHFMEVGTKNNGFSLSIYVSFNPPDLPIPEMLYQRMSIFLEVSVQKEKKDEV